MTQFTASLLENLTISHTIANRWANGNSTGNESLALASLLRAGKELRPQNESVTLVDTMFYRGPIYFSESVLLSDSFFNQPQPSGQSETVSMLDFWSFQAQPISSSEQITLSSAFTFQTGPVGSESIVLSDVMVFSSTLSLMNEAVTLQDTLFELYPMYSNETITISSIFSEFDVGLNLFNETVIVADNMFRLYPMYSNEAVTISSLFTEFDVSLSLMSESLTTADALYNTPAPAALTESISLTDSFPSFQSGPVMSDIKL